MLRFTLGKALYDGGDYQEAEQHLRQAIDLDAGYSAAWQCLGQLLLQAGRWPEALDILQQGIVAAVSAGDKQAEKVMRVLKRRADKALTAQAEEE